MIAKPVTEHVFRISLRMVNVFLIALPGSLTLVDAGTRKSWPRIAKAIGELGRRPEEITDIVVISHGRPITKNAAAAFAATWRRP